MNVITWIIFMKKASCSEHPARIREATVACLRYVISTSNFFLNFSNSNFSKFLSTNLNYINISWIALFKFRIFQIFTKCEPHLYLEKCKTWERIYWIGNNISCFPLSTDLVKELAYFPKTLFLIHHKNTKNTFCCKSLFLWQSSKHRDHYWMSTFLPCRRKLEMAL